MPLPDGLSALFAHGRIRSTSAEESEVGMTGDAVGRFYAQIMGAPADALGVAYLIIVLTGVALVSLWQTWSWLPARDRDRMTPVSRRRKRPRRRARATDYCGIPQ